MKNVGIWMDKEKAHLVTLSFNKATTRTIESRLEFFHPSGGSRSKTRWGPQDVVQEGRYLEREKHQLKNYFKDLAEAISDAEALVIFGPSDTNMKFKKELQQKYPTLARRILGVEKTHRMTNNQIKAFVKEYFKCQ